MFIIVLEKNEKFQQTEMKPLNLQPKAREAPEEKPQGWLARAEVALCSALARVYICVT